MNKIFVFTEEHAPGDYDDNSRDIIVVLSGKSKYNTRMIEYTLRQEWIDNTFIVKKWRGAKMTKKRYETISFIDWLIKEKGFKKVQWDECELD